MNQRPKISILIASRKNSKYLAKFLFGLYANIGDLSRVEILCMTSQLDTWNSELFEFFSSKMTPAVKFYGENNGLGRAGLAEYFNVLYKESKGEWIIYFCEDHYTNKRDWDLRIYEMINKHGLDWQKVYCLVPKFDNAGAMNHILSRGYVEAMGGKLAQHGNLDSYINDVNLRAFGGLSIERHDAEKGDRVLLFDDEMFHDFTHDKPGPMEDAHMQSVISNRGKMMPKYEDPRVQEWISEDSELLKSALERGL